MKFRLRTAVATGATVATLVTGLQADVALAATGTDPAPHTDSAATDATLEVTASDVDVESGTARLDGAVPEGATEVQATWGRKSAQAEVHDGGFTLRIDGLAIGSNPVRVVAFDGDGASVGSTKLDVALVVADVTATATFAEDPQETVLLSGSATPGAPVQIRHEGAVLTTATTGSDGRWQKPLNAPGAPGTFSVTAVQVLRGDDHGTADLDIDYGDGVRIDSPLDGTALAPGEELTVEGIAQASAPVRLYEAGRPGTLLGSTTASEHGSWAVRGLRLDHREVTLVAEAIGKGYNRTRAEVVVNPGVSDVAAPTAEVAFDRDPAARARVAGTGADGARIEVRNGGQLLGTTTVEHGTWSVRIAPVGPGQHTLTIEQSGIAGVQRTSVEVDYGAGVALTSPAAGRVTPGRIAVSGTGQDGATVRVAAGAQHADATVRDGRWTATVEVPAGTDPVQLTATQRSKGALTTTVTREVTPDGQQEARPVVVTGPRDHAYTPGEDVTVTGTATPYAKVELFFQWFPGVPVVETRADVDGRWSAVRQYGPAAEYRITARQHRIDGTTSDSNAWALAPRGAFRSLALDTPANESTFTAGTPVHFSGTATPGATVIATAPKWDGNEIFRTTVDLNGEWTIDRGFAAGITYELTLTQRTADGHSDELMGIVLRPAAS